MASGYLPRLYAVLPLAKAALASSSCRWRCCASGAALVACAAGAAATSDGNTSATTTAPHPTVVRAANAHPVGRRIGAHYTRRSLDGVRVHAATRAFNPPVI